MGEMPSDRRSQSEERRSDSPRAGASDRGESAGGRDRSHFSDRERKEYESADRTIHARTNFTKNDGHGERSGSADSYASKDPDGRSRIETEVRNKEGNVEKRSDSVTEHKNGKDYTHTDKYGGAGRKAVAPIP